MQTLHCFTGAYDRVGGWNYRCTSRFNLGDVALYFESPRLFNFGVVRQDRDQVTSQARPLLGGKASSPPLSARQLGSTSELSAYLERYDAPAMASLTETQRRR